MLLTTPFPAIFNNENEKLRGKRKKEKRNKQNFKIEKKKEMEAGKIMELVFF
jgi:hypothetical protein